MVLCSFMLAYMRMLLYQLICISTAVWDDLGCTQMHFTYWERERGDRKEIMRNGRSGHMRAGDCWVWEKEQEVKDITVSKVRVWCVCVCLCNPYASMRERVNERAHRRSCERDGESERASFMCLYLFLRTECSSGPAGQSSAPCDSSALLFGYGAWQLTSTTNTHTLRRHPKHFYQQVCLQSVLIYRRPAIWKTKRHQIKDKKIKLHAI